MSIFDALTLLGGLCLFLFGMNLMGQALERRAGDKLQTVLGKLTTNKFMGLFTGLGVTAIIQSSSATTVMVVGFVNSGLLTLRQAIHVIMGANIGTTATAWILSLGGIQSDNVVLQLLKPAAFTPVLAVIGIALYTFSKDHKKNDTGLILLGFATLLFGMDSMTRAVSGLADVPEFQQLFIALENPILGVLAGAVLTAIIQSSSASVGVLQALAMTGQVSYGAAIPIIMGQNIGTCFTALISSFGTNKNAKRAALVHLSFNVIGTVVWLSVYCIIKIILSPALFYEGATQPGIAAAHSLFNIACTLLLLPMSPLLEKLVYKIIPDDDAPEKIEQLDERLLATPAFALQRCHTLTCDMAECAVKAIHIGLGCISDYSVSAAQTVRVYEAKTDYYENVIGAYLIKLSARQLSDSDSAECAKLLKIIGDWERIADHAINLVESAKELKDKQIILTGAAYTELSTLSAAIEQVLDYTLNAFVDTDLEKATHIEPLEQVINQLKEHLRSMHIKRLQQGECSIEGGFVWSDLLTNLERTSDHCCNIGRCLLENTATHYSLHPARCNNADYDMLYAMYAKEYLAAADMK